MATLSKLPALTLGLCLYNILKFHCKPLVQWSVSSTEHGITPSKICHEIAPPYLRLTLNIYTCIPEGIHFHDITVTFAQQLPKQATRMASGLNLSYLIVVMHHVY